MGFPALGPGFTQSREAAGRKAPEEEKFGGFVEEAEGSLNLR